MAALQPVLSLGFSTSVVDVVMELEKVAWAGGWVALREGRQQAARRSTAGGTLKLTPEVLAVGA